MRIARWIPRVTDTHTHSIQYLLLLHDNNAYANARRLTLHVHRLSLKYYEHCKLLMRKKWQNSRFLNYFIPFLLRLMGGLGWGNHNLLNAENQPRKFSLIVWIWVRMLPWRDISSSELFTEELHSSDQQVLVVSSQNHTKVHMLYHH